ncbi:MAG: 2-oxoacid:acceptor oxidoreductase subunit alpha [Pseudomonadales bacterium]|nr:2-oxoacid:acceptor oxidoreductase subunit alpha [Pseudomonadales bacterium]MDP6471473.1 2-oxoacid:acceptor oxidoreductase subunit alpha [Pseudomonadales bacterium]MDP6828642.1 2-oxoacid:acceptor oxidoreductase subunit alpha [Pseudomonadales bacterium]MDP6972361.1 2-oxoacid:acceptor oxidoreductase subunit alpha [Pseudomonadales bacterium]
MNQSAQSRTDLVPIRKPRDEPVHELVLEEFVVEIVSDSGEGAQRCGQSFASIAARMGHGIWTVEIIPAEIQPPARSIEGASGNRIRVGTQAVTNGGDEADLVVAFNEQVLLGRIRAEELKPGCTILLEDKWRSSKDESIAAAYTSVHDQLTTDGFQVVEIPMEEECLKYVADPHRGKNMFALGLMSRVCGLDLELALEQVALTFAKKGARVIEPNQQLLQAGWDWAEANLDIRFRVPTTPAKEPRLVVNGNTALGLGVMASGMDVCAMYPITPATSASHYLSDVFQSVGGVVHQAEDEIAACAFAIGASYAGKCAVTITSGPGYSLKQEGIGLAVMGEIPLVVVNVQRGGPSTGQPTKAEQGDLLAACFGGHGDAPKVVMAVSDIEDCFYSVITARKIAEAFNVVVVLLSDASLGSAQQPFVRPQFNEEWLAPPVDQSPVPEGVTPYDWDPETGLATRFIPGQPNGMHCLTGLAHDRMSHIVYNPEQNHETIRRRSLKLAALQKSLKPPNVFGDEEGELLVVGWGSTKGAIEEAVTRVRADGKSVSSLHLKFLQPMASGIKEVLQRFDRVMAVENNWSDDLNDALVDEENRRYSNMAWLLRARCLVDIDCWGEVKGQPLKPGAIERALREKLG